MTNKAMEALAITHGSSTFSKPTATSEPLFRVNPGIPCTDAMAQASVLMDCINRLTLIGGVDGDAGAPVWAAHYLGEQVKAIIDDVAVGLRGARGVEGERVEPSLSRVFQENSGLRFYDGCAADRG